jgi:predicted peptidase
MIHRVVRAIVLSILMLAGGVGRAQSVQQNARELKRTITVTMKYLLYLPKGYEQKPSWPLMIFLHGAGERGDDLALVKKHGPPKLINAGQQFPFIVVSPQCPNGRWWKPLELTALLDEMMGQYKIDKERIYLTGLSMGGFGTWSLAAYPPKRFAALVPVCGGGKPYWSESLAPIPVWAFHGAKDSAVPLERSQKMVEALKKKGGNVKLTVYPKAEHDSWTEDDWRRAYQHRSVAETPRGAACQSEEAAQLPFLLPLRQRVSS